MAYLKKNMKHYPCEDKRESVELAELNSMRKSLGLRPLEHTTRKCLKCKKDFITLTPGGNYLCGCVKESENHTY